MDAAYAPYTAVEGSGQAKPVLRAERQLDPFSAAALVSVVCAFNPDAPSTLPQVRRTTFLSRPGGEMKSLADGPAQLRS